jgi:hypothetical protein
VSENALNWVIVFVLLGIGFGAGWLVFDPDEDEQIAVTAPKPNSTVLCYIEFDAYVRQQVEWLKKHNDELRTIIELDTHNNEVENGDAKKEF